MTLLKFDLAPRSHSLRLHILVVSWIIAYGVHSEFIRSVVLPYQCSPELAPGECRWSNWTQSCFWPQTDLGSTLRNFTEEFESHGCQIPKNAFAQEFLKRRVKLMFSTTVLERMSGQAEPCGACGFRVRCCNKAQNFLRQSLDAQQCMRGTFAKACIVDALTAEELEANRLRHPDWPHISDDMCDFNQFIPIHRTQNEDATSRLLRYLYCSFYGTSQPIITCTKLSNFRCQCCCNGFVPTSDGRCVPDPSPRRKDPLCQRDETEPDTCRWSNSTNEFKSSQ